MKSNTQVMSAVYDEMYFHFCSNQCRETFLEHPDLYLPSETSLPSEIIKRRTLHLEACLEQEVVDLLVPYLEEMMGVKEVTVEGEKLHITYNLLQVKETQIERVLMEVGVELGGSWLERLRRGWVDDSEETELENLEAAPSGCCHWPPRRA